MLTGPAADRANATLNHEYSLKDVLTVLFRRRMACLLVFTGVVSTVVVWTVVVTPVYEITAAIVVKDDRAAIPLAPTESRELIITTVGEEDLNSEVEMLRSRELLVSVLRTPGVTPTQRPQGWLDRLVAAFRTAYRQATRRPALSPFDELVLKLERKLKVEPVRKSRVIEIAFRNEDAAWGELVVQTLLERYLERRVQVYQQPQAVSFFEDQTASARTRLQQAEDALAPSIRTAGISIPLEPQKQVALENLGQFEQQLAGARAEIEQRTKMMVTLRQRLDAEPQWLPTADRQHLDPAFEQIQSRLLALQLQRDELIQNFGPGNRRTRDLDAQIRLAEARLEEATLRAGTINRTELNQTHQELRGQLATTEADLEGARGRAASIAEQVGQSRAQLAALNRKGFVLKRLQRDVVAAEEAFVLYTKKQEESRISDAMDQQQMVNVSVLHDARASLEPVSPNVAMSLLLAVVLAAMGALGAAFGLELSSHSLMTSQALERQLGLRHLASVPETDAL